MATYAAFLRGINVGGNKMVAMSDLRAMLEDLGFTGAKSLLQSGNLIFETRKRTSRSLEQLLESETEKRLGISVQYIVRSSEEFAAIIEANPFPAEAEGDPGHLLAMFLKAQPEGAALEALRGAIRGRETFRAVGKELYIVYPDGVGTSKFTNALIEKTLGTAGTARNWNTVLKVAALLTG